MCTQQEINNKIKQDYELALKKFGEARVLGAFLIGPDLTTVVVYFPGVGDVAINCAPTNSWLYEAESGYCRLVDFRLIPELLCDRKDFISNIFFTQSCKLSSLYQKLFTALRDEMHSLKISDWLAGDNLNLLAEWWSKIFDRYLQFRGGVQFQVLDSFTKTEEKALTYILDTIGAEGILSISQAIQGSGISRPVFTSLLDKLDRYQAAEVKNMGVKGTYIHLYDHILVKFENL